MTSKTQSLKGGLHARYNFGSALLTGAIACAVSGVTNAQGTRPVEEVIVTGTRATIQNQIELKRNSTEIVDGLNAEEIGELPALSIGEALESITSAATHRENGGATEVAIRGLGPYLGTTVVNGRESTNGSGNRAVNFSIFPSEMFNKIAIHKTQSAKYIEGAVSGQVHLDTRKPIEYGKQRVQMSLKGSMHPDDQDIVGQDEVGYRATASYINSWELDNGGAIGISIGGQKRDDSNPEAEAFHTTGGGRLEACELDSFDANALPIDLSGRCHDGANDISNDELADIIAANPNYNSVADVPFAYIARDRTYRHNTTDDEREALFGAFQWQPNDDVDIMLDFQMSERDQKELRYDLQFDATQNNITELVSNPRTGVVESVTTDTGIRATTTDFQRLEEYTGGGLNIAWQVTDTLKLSFDASTAETERTETDVAITMGATNDGAIQRSRDDFIVRFDLNAPGTDGLSLPTILCDDGSSTCDPASMGDFDITDPLFFTAGERARVRARQIIRENTIDAVRLDFSWDTELGFVNNVEGGLRISSQEYRTFGGNRSRPGENLWEDEDLAGIPNGNRDAPEALAAVAAAASNCGHASFLDPEFLSESRGDNNLFTFAHGIGTGNSWATFDYDCLLDELLVNYGGSGAVQLQNGLETDSIDLTEDTVAFYLQANYESEIGGKPVRGNFGVRVVETEIESTGFRSELSVVEGIDPGPDMMEGTADDSPEFFILAAPSGSPLERVTQTNSYTEVLPSVTFIMDLNEELIFRAGAFRGISRPDPHSYSNAREIDDSSGTDPGTGFASLEDAVQGIAASGNPQLEPLPSWNLDLALEWYVNDDTMITGGVYWKEFQGGFESVFQQEDFLIDGNIVSGTVRTTQVSDEKSELVGFEFTATHAFDYLPGFLSGLGAKVSYNYADSDFEFEDGHGGDGVAFDADGNATPLLGILPPAGLWGLSEHTTSSQLYWQNDRVNIGVLYKTRSQYFQGFGRDTTSRVRYVDNYQQVDLRFSYDITDNIKLSAEALNILSEPRVDYRAIEGNVMSTLEYGPRVFFGVKAKF